MHTSAKFWKENAGKLADNNCQLLKVILELLKSGREVGPCACRAAWLGFCPHLLMGKLLPKQHAQACADTAGICSAAREDLDRPGFP